LLVEEGLEVIRPDLPRGRFRVAVFDFDGTLSLLRGGWMGIMVSMMLDVLRQTSTEESDEQLRETIEDFVMRNNGRPTIYQMLALVEQVEQRGAEPEPVEVYLDRYHEKLLARVRERVREVQSGLAPPERWVVPGSHVLLKGLRKRGVHLILASGTEVVHVRQEADLLQLTEWFEDRVYGPGEEATEFSKARVIDQAVAEHGLRAGELVAFGDGPVEIAEARRVGGVAVAVASDEVRREGVNEWKRDRLIAAGADLVVPHYRDHERLLRYLFAEDGPEFAATSLP
jgi:phosphoglycolate phosphatase-like HAD superfamily hydrolase